MHYPRPAYDQTHPRTTSQIAIGRCSIARGLFVSKANEPDANIDCCLGDGRDGIAGEAKNNINAEIFQGQGGDVGASYLLFCMVRSHLAESMSQSR